MLLKELLKIKNKIRKQQFILFLIHFLTRTIRSRGLLSTLSHGSESVPTPVTGTFSLRFVRSKPGIDV